jgi:hypothetical protein
MGGGKQGGEVTRCPRSPEEQKKHSNAAVCRFHTAPSSLMPREEYPPREVVASKCQKNLPLARVWMRGRWKRWQWRRNH